MANAPQIAFDNADTNDDASVQFVVRNETDSPATFTGAVYGIAMPNDPERFETPRRTSKAEAYGLGLELGPALTLEQAKAAHIRAVLGELDWNMTEAARVLAIDRRTLYRLVDRYSLARPARD